MSKNILTLAEFLTVRSQLKKENKKLVFTNGCFDILHAGHVDYLAKARAQGDAMVVALNSDASVRRIKGSKRPVVNQDERTFIISNLKSVDYVIIFEEDTPHEVIQAIIPDILVKGADWQIDKIVGKDIVEANGGQVITIEFINNQSTTNIIKTILERFKEE